MSNYVFLIKRKRTMSSQTPILIREPDLRWPIYLLAAIITAVIVLVTVGVMHLALTQTLENHVSEPRVEGLIRPGMPEFEKLREKIIVDQPVAGEFTRSLDDSSIEVGGTVRNTTGRTISGLEIRAALLDPQYFSVSERSVLIVPARQTVLEPGEAIKVRLLLEGVSPAAERVSPLLEVTGIGFY
jgi:hypothetical protein